MIEEAIGKIEAQQEGIEGTAPWMVGEQLKDICRREPDSAELIAQDLANEGMSLAEAEKKIKDYADGHKKGSFACVTPDVAEGILRKFYGLPDRREKNSPPAGKKVIDLTDFL